METLQSTAGSLPPSLQIRGEKWERGENLLARLGTIPLSIVDHKALILLFNDRLLL